MFTIRSLIISTCSILRFPNEEVLCKRYDPFYATWSVCSLSMLTSLAFSSPWFLVPYFSVLHFYVLHFCAAFFLVPDFHVSHFQSPLLLTMNVGWRAGSVERIFSQESVSADSQLVHIKTGTSVPCSSKKGRDSLSPELHGAVTLETVYGQI